MRVRFLVTLGIFIATCSISNAVAEESQIADDRIALLIRVESDRFFLPEFIKVDGTEKPTGRSPWLANYRQQIKSSPWNIQAIELSPEEFDSAPIAVSRCKGTMRTPILENRKIKPTDFYHLRAKNSMGAKMDQIGWNDRNEYEWTYGPCYWIATTQYVEDRIDATIRPISKRKSRHQPSSLGNKISLSNTRMMTFLRGSAS